MFIEVINAIAGLGFLALVLCVTILAGVFREQIISLLETADIRIRYGKAEIDVRKQLPQQEQPQIEETKILHLNLLPKKRNPLSYLGENPQKQLLKRSQLLKRRTLIQL